jgi:hypothetical protein
MEEYDAYNASLARSLLQLWLGEHEVKKGDSKYEDTVLETIIRLAATLNAALSLPHTVSPDPVVLAKYEEFLRDTVKADVLKAVEALAGETPEGAALVKRAFTMANERYMQSEHTLLAFVVNISRQLKRNKALPVEVLTKFDNVLEQAGFTRDEILAADPAELKDLFEGRSVLTTMSEDMYQTHEGREAYYNS